jgi:predicted permease
MGAGRFRLIRQLLTETAVLSFAGGIAGAIVASLVMKPLFDNVSGLVPENARVAVNLSVLAVTAAVALLSGLVVGLVPALRLSRVRIGAALSRASRTQGAPLSRRGGQILIAAEVALTIVVVAGAALLVRSYLRMGAVDAGYDRSAIVTMDVTPLDQDDDATIEAFYPALLEAVRTRPEVAAAGLCDCFKRNVGDRVAVAGGTDAVRLTSRGVTPGVLEALDVTLRMGRLPSDRDLAVQPTPVVLSESAARRLFAERSPLGERVQFARAMREVIGVVTDVNFQAPFARDRSEVFYVSADAHPVYTSLVLRPRADAPNLVARLREAVQSVGTPSVIDAIRTGRERPDERVQMAGQRAFLAGLLALLSGTLALVGVFGMTAFAVARRVHEIGVRMALGATPGRVVRDTVRDAAVPAAIGLVIGLTGAALSTRVIARLLFNTSPTDAATFAAVTILLGVGACLAAWLPARRAARVDPVRALAGE